MIMRLKTLRKSKAAKTIMLSAGLSLIFQVVSPTISYALTGGPEQPEFQGFTQIDTGNLVDPFTGDFKYQIPLMTIPGPNGGYPLNLTYTAGPSLEEEASWVGLGWSLNAGAINRQMRGVPDDFRGDPITKTQYTKPNTTLGFGLGLSFSLPEIYGADIGTSLSIGLNSQFYSNNYTGFGYRHTISPSIGLSSTDSESSAGLSSALNISFDSNEGADVQPTFGMKARDGKNSMGMDFGFGYSGRQGFTGMYMSASYTRHQQSSAAYAKKNREATTSHGSSFSFSTSSAVPRTTMPLSGTNFAFSIKMDAGAFDNQFKIPITFQGRFSRQKVASETQRHFAFGLHYAGDMANDNGHNMMDYNIEKDAAINVKIPNLPIPVSTHDIYSVQASQLSLSFRNYRNDMGVFYEPPVLSQTIGGDIGIEAGSGSGFKVGVNPKLSYALSYSGPWKGNAVEVLGKYGFRGTPDEDALLTNTDGVRTNSFSYLKVSGEPTADIAGSGFRMAKAGGTFGPVKFPINSVDASNEDFSEHTGDTDPKELFAGIQQFTTGISPQLGSQALNTNFNDQRHRRNTLIEHRTQDEVTDNNDGILKRPYISTSCMTPETSTFNVNGTFTFPTDMGHHIAEYSILEPGGMRYTFGLPAYNMKQHDVTFAISAMEQADASDNSKLVTYTNGSTGADRVKNFEGRDHFYSKTEMPAYTHSHLLTLITSPDYVDATNNGPTEDDYGYYTKFNYYRAHSNYRWRTPFEQNKANHYKGFYSSALDNKGSYNYGEKEVWYVHSIETKTHVAIFVLEDRNDAHGTLGKDGGLDETQSLKRLKEIRLYAKKQIVGGVLPAKPIKTVVFTYTYELCKGIPNNKYATDTGADPSDKGKLTLTKVHFLYNGNKRGELNPYEFEYGHNPDYSPMQSDRWGNYRPDASGNTGGNEENPYVNQDEDDAAKALRDLNAAAWSISQITTPSNAVIQISYEQDDYGCVQDKAATQMFQMVGTGKDNGTEIKFLECDYIENTIGISGEEHVQITRDFNRIYFRPENQEAFDAMSDGERNMYIKRHVMALTDKWLYFKTWQRLQRPKNRTYWAEDYVTGYAKVRYPSTWQSDYGYATRNGKRIPFITVEDTENNVIKNPLQLAGLQYLRYSRGDLNMPQTLNNGSEAAITIITTGLTMIMQTMELMTGYYTYAKLNNYCKFIEKDKPSFIRLVSPDGRKYGGGHRVKSIKVRDGWNESSLDQEEYVYKQDYFYTDIHGNSSGVAAYEPSLGNDENPLKYPFYYSPDNKFNNDPAFMTEAPFNESYYPAPVVGYSRVTIRSDINYNDQVELDPLDVPDAVKATGDAIRVYEFYTAKDYPVITENTTADNVKNMLLIPVPLIGGIQITNYGYSQGYMIELNDMHGKSKAEYTYASSAWDYTSKKLRNDAAFVSAKTYKYNTVGGYSPNKRNRVNSVLQVMDNEGETRFAVVGESADVFSNLREDSGMSISAGAQINGGIDALPYMGFVSAMPGIEYSENTARISVTNKVIYKTGVLVETVERMEGAVKTTANLLFDAENGQPLLTAVTTDYDKHNNTLIDAPIYTYSMPAHWYYDGMRPSYKNYRTVINLLNVTMGGNYIFPMNDADKYLFPGDEVYYLDEGSPANLVRYWVDDVTGAGFKLRDNTGALVSGQLNGKFTVVRSGYRNQQNQTAGTIVSLNNPIGENLAFFKLYNEQIYGHSTFQGINVNVSSFPVDAFEGISFPNPCVPEISLVWNDSPHANFVNTPGIIENLWLGSFYALEGEEPLSDCRIGFLFEDIGEGMIPASEFKFNRLRLYYPGSGDGWAYYDLANGQTIKLKMVPYGVDCPYLVCLEGILDAKAVEYQNEWTYPIDFPVSPTFANNLWMTTGKGVWRVLRTNTYFTERKQGGTVSDFKSYIGRDGTYRRFIPFNFVDGNDNNAQMSDGWRWAAEVPATGYGRGGYELENRNALDIYSSEIFGFRQSSVIAVAANARYHEIGFESFERPGQVTDYTGPGSVWNFLKEGESNHILFANSQNPSFTPYGNFSLSTEKSHTGMLSLKHDGTHMAPFGVLPLKVKVIDPGTQFDSGYDGLQLYPSKRYLISFWFYDGNDGSTSSCVAAIQTNGIVVGLGQYDMEESIEGWRKCTLEFTAPNATSVPLNLFVFGWGDFYLDDFRIHPVEASFKSYVYDPIRFILKAELDDNNYATLYNYDQEWNLTQVKKETRKGIMTIRSTKKHVKPRNIPE